METVKVGINEIVEVSGDGEGRTIKTINGYLLASAVEIVFTEPEPLPHASPSETRPIRPPIQDSPMHYLPV